MNSSPHLSPASVVHRKVRKCYACTINVENPHRNRITMLSSFVEYEMVVEYIESLPVRAEFTRMTVWRALGKGHKLYGLVGYAIFDMLGHGLIVCVRRSVNNNCLSYMVRPELLDDH